jgi:hypothetical protein
MTPQSYMDPEADADRLEARLRLLGTRTPSCRIAGCAEDDPFALTGVSPDLLCAEHAAEHADRSPVEQSHTAGRANAPDDTVELPANDHAVLTHAHQAGWPLETLRNTDGSPLLRAAAATRGWLDVLRLIIERTIGWIPGFLERLDDWLRIKVGDRWWGEFEGWQPSATR